MESINNLIETLAIPIISTERSYWLVRANSGDYFDEYIFNEYIGIGWDKIDNESYFELSSSDLKEKIKDLYPDEKMPGNVSGQLLRFANEVKKGDIVLIPNKNSKYIAFCEVLDDSIYYEKTCENSSDMINEAMDETESIDCPHIKRKQIRLLKMVNRRKLDPYLYQILYSHHTISCANQYAHQIDRTLNSFYIKDNKVHIIYEVTRTDQIPAVDFLSSLNSILSITDVYNSVSSEQFNKHDIELKVNVQSPGPIELISYVCAASVLIGAIGSFLFGGKHNFKFNPFNIFNIEAERESKGLLDYILKFKEQEKNNSKYDSVELKKKVDKLEEDLDKAKSDLELIIPGEDEAE